MTHGIKASDLGIANNSPVWVIAESRSTVGPITVRVVVETNPIINQANPTGKYTVWAHDARDLNRWFYPIITTSDEAVAFQTAEAVLADQ